MPTLCQLCGAHFPESERPSVCPLCEDVRGLGFTPRGGARITTLEEFQTTHTLTLREEEPSLLGIGVEPSFSAGNRALVVQTSEGNVMWDCIPLILEPQLWKRADLRARQGPKMGHPSRCCDRVLGGGDPGAPRGSHAGPLRGPLRRCGRAPLAGRRRGSGALFSGDPTSVTPDRHVTFMYAYPNLIPLGAGAVQHIAYSIAPFPVDRIHGGWFGRRVPRYAKAAVDRSVERYLLAIQ